MPITMKLKIAPCDGLRVLIDGDRICMPNESKGYNGCWMCSDSFIIGCDRIGGLPKRGLQPWQCATVSARSQSMNSSLSADLHPSFIKRPVPPCAQVCVGCRSLAAI